MLSCRQMHVNRKGIEAGEFLSLETVLNIHEKEFTKNTTQTAYNSKNHIRFTCEVYKVKKKNDIFCVVRQAFNLTPKLVRLHSETYSSNSATNWDNSFVVLNKIYCCS